MANQDLTAAVQELLDRVPPYIEPPDEENAQGTATYDPSALEDIQFVELLRLRQAFTSVFAQLDFLNSDHRVLLGENQALTAQCNDQERIIRSLNEEIQRFAKQKNSEKELRDELAQVKARLESESREKEDVSCIHFSLDLPLLFSSSFFFPVPSVLPCLCPKVLRRGFFLVTMTSNLRDRHKNLQNL